MDLKSSLEQKRKVLKPCSTIITHTDGRKFEISGGESKELSSGVPFVVDTKPDMQVAMILPGLFLSSQDPASDLETLKEHGIHHILSLGVEPGVKFEGIEYSFFNILDLPESSLSQAAKRCSEIIKRHKKDNILVHCNAGISRSPAVIIYHLMTTEKMSYEAAYDKVKTVRNCIRPNDGFVKQLKGMQF